MSENLHADAATKHLHNGTHNEVARASVEATLALAFEHRTANLLAAFAQLGEGDVSTYLGDAIVCTGCGTDDGNWKRWPCPTITVVTAVLGGGE